MPKPLSPRVRSKPVGHYHHGELRRALLDAALAIAAREGTGALSLRAVARHAGVSATAAYRHFEDRAALLAAAAEEGLAVLAAQMREAGDRAGGPAEVLGAIGLAYVAFATSHPAHFRLLSLPEVADVRSRPTLLAAYEEAFGVLLFALEACQKAGVVRSGDPRGLALVAWSAVHGASWLLVDGQIDASGIAPEPDRVARRVLRVLFEGLAP